MRHEAEVSGATEQAKGHPRPLKKADSGTTVYPLLCRREIHRFLLETAGESSAGPAVDGRQQGCQPLVTAVRREPRATRTRGRCAPIVVELHQCRPRLRRQPSEWCLIAARKRRDTARAMSQENVEIVRRWIRACAIDETSKASSGLTEPGFEIESLPRSPS